jgi:hypothetical protein
MRYRAGILLCVLACELLAGCAANSLQAEAVTAHRWRKVDTPPTKPWTGELSQVYTYVLAGDIVGGSANPSVKLAYEALGRVLSEVGAFSPMPSSGAEPIPLGNVNQFVVPARDVMTSSISLANYDFDLAHDYVAWFASALRQAPEVQIKLQGLGPFLVATKKPLWQLMAWNGVIWKVSVSEPILVFDLSGATLSAVPLYVSEYKKIIADGVLSTSSPTSWKADLANFLVRVGDALPRAVAATAQAGEILHSKPAKDKP